MNSPIVIQKNILFELLKITTAEEVDKLIQSHDFFKNCKWEYYGAMENNAGIIKAQSPDPVGALVEKITNGNDSLLIRRCWENNIDPTSSDAPQSQYEAVKLFYGEDIANYNLTEKQTREIASSTVRIIAEGEKDKPTLTVIDFGEGQQPQDFSNTFLSIGHSNKTKIKFAHGVYNQGGSASLKFCGGGYQLVLSKRAPSIQKSYDDSWGFTLVRERYEQGSKAEQYEYCVMKEGDKYVIPHFGFEPLKIPSMNITFESGSLVRLYSYILKNANLFITGQRERELAREINKRYFSMPLPIELNELRTTLPGWAKKNEKTRIYGLWRLLAKQLNDKNLIRHKLLLQGELGVFGLRKIEILVLNDESQEGQSYKNQTDKVFFTVNGQAQHTETVNFLKTDCLLPDLAQFMIVHVDLSNANYQANKIFQTARSGVIAIPEYDVFRTKLIKAIKEDNTLIELDKEYKQRKLTNTQPEDKDLSRYIEKLVKNNTSFIPYFQIGLEIPVEKPIGPKTNYVGNYIPTFMELIGINQKLVPCNRYSWIRLKTDAKEDYLTRESENGDFSFSHSKIVEINQYSLRDGVIPIKIEPRSDSKVGEKDTLSFELTRPGLSSLAVKIDVEIGPPETPRINPKGKPKQANKSALKLPEKRFISKEQWEERNWNGTDIAEVNESHDGITVYINKEPDVLTEFPLRNPKYKSGDMISAVRKKYYATIYLYAIAMFFEMGKDSVHKEKRDWALPISLKAISKFLLDLEFSSRSTKDNN
jgi:hypothetical protein